MKRKIFLILLVMFLSVFTLSLINVNAAEDDAVTYTVKGSSATTQEGNVFTFNKTSGYVYVETSITDLASGFHIALRYKSEGISCIQTLIYASSLSDPIWPAVIWGADGLPKPGWNVKETPCADGSVIATVDLSSKVETLGEVTKVRFNIDCVEGATLEILGFNITTNGEHGLEDKEESDAIIFTGSSSVTVRNNVATLLGTSGSISTNVNITDLSSVYVTIVYKQNGITDISSRVCDSTGKYQWPAVFKPATSSKVVETVYKQNGYVITTANLTSYVSGGAMKDIVEFTLNLSGSQNATLEIMDFIVTNDGNHGLETPMDISNFSNSSSSTLKYSFSVNENNEDVVSYDITNPSSWVTANFDIINYDEEYSFVLLTFTPENDMTIGIKVNSNYKGGHVPYEGGKTYKVLVDLNFYEATGDKVTIALYMDAETGNTVPNSVTFHSIDLMSNISGLLTKYYNNGSYVRNTTINLTEAAKADLKPYFHVGANTLVRTTYFEGSELWMSRGNGTYSYYGSQNGYLTSGSATEAKVTPETVTNAIANSSMEQHYTTMYDIKDLDVEWTYENGVYTSTDEKAKKAFLDFTAPCFLNFSKENSNLFNFTKVTVELTEEGLVLSLWVDSENYGFVEGGLAAQDNILSQAIITLE